MPRIAPDAAGVRHVQLSQFGRIELCLGAGVDAGYLRVGESLRPLPDGSHLDRTSGQFSWAPGRDSSVASTSSSSMRRRRSDHGHDSPANQFGVAAAFGAQFDRAGWTLQVSDLEPGIYDVVAYFWSSRTGRFEDARTVRITVH